MPAGKRLPAGLKYLLDTNVVSELRKQSFHAGLLAWLDSAEDAHLQVAAITLREIQAAIELTRAQDAAKAAEIEAWLDLLAGAYNVLPMDSAAFRMWARLMHRRSDARYEDAMIAAVAKTHGLTVVTRNASDFAHFGVALVNPFDGASPQHSTRSTACRTTPRQGPRTRTCFTSGRSSP